MQWTLYFQFSAHVDLGLWTNNQKFPNKTFEGRSTFQSNDNIELDILVGISKRKFKRFKWCVFLIQTQNMYWICQVWISWKSYDKSYGAYILQNISVIDFPCLLVTLKWNLATWMLRFEWIKWQPNCCPNSCKNNQLKRVFFRQVSF